MSADVLVSHFYVFLLATFLGLEIIRRVSPLLHTPLMSLTNAISAIAVVGSIVVAGEQKTTLSTVLGTIAVAASMVNIVGGYLITYRMLSMFRKDKGPRQ
jgi:NAD(P) transhydrogenase subunit alpha